MSGRVLLVTDDANAGRALRAAFAPLQGEWEATVARGAVDAMRRLDGPSYDALVTDAQLGGAGCAELLIETRHRPVGRR